MKRLWAIPVLAAILAVLPVSFSVCMQAIDARPVRAAALPVGAVICAAAGIALLGTIRRQKERKQ